MSLNNKMFKKRICMLAKHYKKKLFAINKKEQNKLLLCKSDMQFRVISKLLREFDNIINTGYLEHYKHKALIEAAAEIINEYHIKEEQPSRIKSTSTGQLPSLQKKLQTMSLQGKLLLLLKDWKKKLPEGLYIAPPPKTKLKKITHPHTTSNNNNNKYNRPLEMSDCYSIDLNTVEKNYENTSTTNVNSNSTNNRNSFFATSKSSDSSSTDDSSDNNSSLSTLSSSQQSHYVSSSSINRLGVFAQKTQTKVQKQQDQKQETKTNTTNNTNAITPPTLTSTTS
jgi:hypothetical protein